MSLNDVAAEVATRTGASRIDVLAAIEACDGVTELDPHLQADRAVLVRQAVELIEGWDRAPKSPFRLWCELAVLKRQIEELRGAR